MFKHRHVWDEARLITHSFVHVSSFVPICQPMCCRLTRELAHDSWACDKSQTIPNVWDTFDMLLRKSLRQRSLIALVATLCNGVDTVTFQRFHHASCRTQIAIVQQSVASLDSNCALKYESSTISLLQFRRPVSVTESVPASSLWVSTRLDWTNTMNRYCGISCWSQLTRMDTTVHGRIIYKRAISKNLVRIWLESFGLRTDSFINIAAIVTLSFKPGFMSHNVNICKWEQDGTTWNQPWWRHKHEISIWS